MNREGKRRIRKGREGVNEEVEGSRKGEDRQGEVREDKEEEREKERYSATEERNATKINI